MGLYLITYDGEQLTELFDDEDGGFDSVNEVLHDLGIPPLEFFEMEAGIFEEKLSYPSDSFDELVKTVLPTLDVQQFPLLKGSARVAFPAQFADLWLPVPFSGLATLPGVPGIYNDNMTIASSVQLVAQCDALVSAIGMPVDDLPELGCLAFNQWHDNLEVTGDRKAPIWRRDRDLRFHLALYREVAHFSVNTNAVVGYC